MDDWYIVQFDASEVVEAKKIRELKDSNKWGNRFDSSTRWTGYLGEMAFKFWLDQLGLQYTHWNFIEVKDKRDFTVGRLEIDVKTIATNFFPRKSYSCLVACSQLDNENVNAFVFCRYLLKEDKVVIMGWLPKEEFLDKSIFREKGYQEDNFVVPTDMRKVFMYQLKPLMDIDRWK